MAGSRRIIRAAAMLAAALTTAPGAADERVFTATNGVRIAVPAIATLDCAGMAAVVRRLDLSGYRGIAPLPAGHPDRPIFDYEDALSRRQFWRCRAGNSRYMDPGEAFHHGFAPG